MIPYGRHSIDKQDIDAVVEALQSDWLTTGPMVGRFEEAVAKFVGATHGVAVSSGTAALHCAMYAAGIGPGDEVILPSLTFAATANAALYLGATPVFVDIDRESLLLDLRQLEAKIGPKTKALVCVDYAGLPCDYTQLREIARRHKVLLIADSCHSIGAMQGGKKIGSLADLTVFSFHPVKHITTGEGGMVMTENADFARRMRVFRSHGITTDHRQREEAGTWHYEMTELGFNYRICDFQCALGLSQLQRLPAFLARRNEIARLYEAGFAGKNGLRTQATSAESYHAYHLFPLQVDWRRFSVSKQELFAFLRTNGIHTAVHYPPLHLHPYYRKRFGYQAGDFPVTEEAYQQLLSLPMFPGMSDEDVQYVIRNVSSFLKV